MLAVDVGVLCWRLDVHKGFRRDKVVENQAMTTGVRDVY